MDVDIGLVIRPFDVGFCGEDPEELEQYDEIEDTLARETSINPVPVDWQKTGQMAYKLLTTQTKDLMLASYVAYGSFIVKEDYAKLALSFDMLCQFYNCDYWESLYPPREKTRAKAVSWLSGKLQAHFSTLEPETISGSADLSNLLAVMEGFKGFFNIVSEKLPEQSNNFPALYNLRKTFKDLQPVVQSLLEAEEQKNEQINEQKNEQEFPQPEAQAAKNQASQNTQPAQERSKQDLSSNEGNTRSSEQPKTRKAFSDLLKDGAASYFDENNNEADAFFFRRVAMWSSLEQLPPHDLLQIQPSVQGLASMNEALQNQEYEQVIQQAEANFNNGAVFNLDMQRLVCLALRGIQNADAENMVKNALRYALSRFPDWPLRRFIVPGASPAEPNSSQTAADAATQTWLKHSVLGSEGTTQEGGKPERTTQERASQESVGTTESSITPTATPWQTAAQQAIEIGVNGGNAQKQALQSLYQGLAEAASEREKTHWRFELARVCEQFGLYQLAIPQLEFLRQHLGEISLYDWEPELQKSLLKSLLNCHTQQHQKQNYQAHALEFLTTLRQELTLLDPVSALELEI